MALIFAFDIDQDIIFVYNHKDVKLLSLDFIGIHLVTGINIGEAKEYELILKCVYRVSKALFHSSSFQLCI